MGRDPRSSGSPCPELTCLGRATQQTNFNQDALTTWLKNHCVEKGAAEMPETDGHVLQEHSSWLA